MPSDEPNVTQNDFWASVGGKWIRLLVLTAGVVLILYLCWRILLPFLPALSWAFALALIVRPAYEWMVRNKAPRNVAALITVLVAAAVLIVPAIFLGRALVREATDVFSRFSNEAAIDDLRSGVESNRIAGSALRWLDLEFDLPEVVRAAAKWASSAVSPFLAGSVWALTQIGTALFVLFYFLRDGVEFANRLQSAIPLHPHETSWLFARISQSIRVTLGGKVVMAGIQGTLGGLIFFRLGLPGPIFWGFVMGVLSILPVVGSFIVWGPVAITYALQGDWRHALFLTGWGVLVINPVDNLLGPVLIGSTLRLHTLLMFFSLVGGLAAFGASGFVLGPVIVAIAAGLVEIADHRRRQESA